MKHYQNDFYRPMETTPPTGDEELRAEFAKAAMQGFCSQSIHVPDAKTTAEKSVAFADALIIALSPSR